MTRQPGRKGSLSHRMFVALVVACAGVAVVVTAAASLLYQSAFLADEHEQLAAECRTLASLLDQTDDDAAVLATSHGSATLQFKKAWEHLARCPQDVPLGNCCILVYTYDRERRAFINQAIVNPQL